MEAFLVACGTDLQLCPQLSKACGTDLQLCPQLSKACGTDLQLCPQLIERIDWAAPWLAPWRLVGELVAQGVLAGNSQPLALNQAALVQTGCPVRFVPQSELPLGLAYEQHIFDSGCVPTPVSSGHPDLEILRQALTISDCDSLICIAFEGTP